VQTFADRLDALRLETVDRGIAINDVDISLTAVAGSRFLLREAALLVTAGPLALWGRVNHWLPLRLARLIARRMSRLPDEPAMLTIVSGFILVVAFYAIQSTVVGLLLGLPWALLYAVSLPVSASWDFRFSERRARAIDRSRAYRLLRRDPQLCERLRHALRELRAEASELDRVASAAEARLGSD
jgi:hypothetical protein